MGLLFGCIADDFTGASDAASFIAKSGMETVLFNGVPETKDCEGADAAVIALKTRTQEKEQAVGESLRAVRWLIDQGAEHIYVKYCSTFDSTPEGNIGPVMDAVLEECEERSSILCPALPVNGRVVKGGVLYVNGIPLSESPMKNHPLTPMWESRIDELMKPQSKYPCINIASELLSEGKERTLRYIEEAASGMERYYLIPDYANDEDAGRIVELFGDMKVLSGGSGILSELGGRYLQGKEQKKQIESRGEGLGIILAGSCSVATLGQIEAYKRSGRPAWKIDPAALMEEKETADSIWDEVQRRCQGQDVLIYSSDTPERVRKLQRYGKEKVAEMIEKTLAGVAVNAEKSGYKRIIAAGGETSGAVTKALGYRSYRIGESVDPGVPVMIPIGHEEIRLVLKSGNFGQEDFFLKALAMTAKKEQEEQEA